MTIGTNFRNDANGNDSTDTYPYGYKVFAATDLVVIVRQDSSGIETELSYPTQFSVSNVGNKNGGNVVLAHVGGAWQNVDGTLKTGYSITNRREVIVQQLTDIRNQGGFFADVHEDEFDYLTMIDQQQQDGIDRSLKLPQSEEGDVDLVTLPFDRAETFLAFDSLKRPIASTGGLTGVPAETVTRQVSTMADLKALPVPSAIIVYLILGYVAAGDGGGGFYWWNASDVTADNGGTVIQLNAGGNGRFNRLF